MRPEIIIPGSPSCPADRDMADLKQFYCDCCKDTGREVLGDMV